MPHLKNLKIGQRLAVLLGTLLALMAAIAGAGFLIGVACLVGRGAPGRGELARRADVKIPTIRSVWLMKSDRRVEPRKSATTFPA